jgi:hypothetical protein
MIRKISGNCEMHSILKWKDAQFAAEYRSTIMKAIGNELLKKQKCEF